MFRFINNLKFSSNSSSLSQSFYNLRYNIDNIKYFSRLSNGFFISLSKYQNNFKDFIPSSYIYKNNSLYINNNSLSLYSNNNDKNNSNNESNNSNSNNKNNENNENDQEKAKKLMTAMLIYGLISLTVTGLFFYKILTQNGVETLNWKILQKQISEGNVIKKIVITDKGTQISVHYHNGDHPKAMGISNEKRFIEKLEDFQYDMNISTIDYIPITYESTGFFLPLLLSLLPVVILGYIFLRTNGRAGKGGLGGMGGMDIFSIGDSKHKVASLKDIKTRFCDVAGADEAKEEVSEFVSFLKNPEKYQKLGAKIPKGALLVGPPGTGKTLLAKAIAGEAGVPFFSMSGSDFMEMFVGVGPSRVRDLFKKAREQSPCIIWIDEIDAIGRKRSASGQGNDERENTLNQLLVEMDGFKTTTNVVVLAGTNRADILDSALLRPGRFDRQISVDAPDIKGRKDIFDVHLKKITLKDKIEDYSKQLAALTPSMTGAEIANVVNEGALIAARKEKDYVEFKDFEEAIERVIAGLEQKTKVLSKDEKIRVAYHEAGHAIAGWFLQYANPLLKVSIVPRGNALGYAQYQPKDQHLYNTQQFDHQVCTLLAGRASEELKFNNISTGARDDLERVTQIIYSQLIQYGMNSKIGNLAFPEESGHNKRSFSEETCKKIDIEAKSIVLDAYKRTIDLLKSKEDLIEKVAQHLLKYEVLKKQEMVSLVGERPFKEITTFDEMIGESEYKKE